MKTAILVMAFGVMVASGFASLPADSEFPVVALNEAESVWGGACTEVGASFSHCCSCWCATWGSNTNSGNATNGDTGSSGVGTLYCPCDTTNEQTIAAGSCTTGS